jgi:hypothetical protein
MTCDRGRAEVYAAEAAAFDGTDLETIRTFADVSAAIAAVVEGPWWPGPLVRVVPARRDARSSSARDVAVASTVIRLAAEQLTIATAAHELAHALAGPSAGHSSVFLTAYLDVVAVITNLDARDRRHELHVGQLRRALDAVGLVAGPRTWPPPPEASSTAIAL